MTLSPAVAAALDPVVVDPGGRTARVGSREVAASSPGALRGELTRVLYDVLHAGHTGGSGARDTDLERRLAAVVPHATTTATARAAGERVVELDGVLVRLPACRETGAEAMVTIPCARPRLSPGHFLVDGSRGHGLEEGPVLRVYLHLACSAAAVVVWGRVLTALEETGVRYRAKVCSRPDSFPRRDALVVYLGPDAWHAVGAVAAAAGTDVAPEVSPFAHRIAPGVALAWEPADTRPGRGGLSFGMHRAAAVADGLVDRAVADTPGSRASAVARALAAAGADPAHPYRNTISPRTL